MAGFLLCIVAIIIGFSYEGTREPVYFSPRAAMLFLGLIVVAAYGLARIISLRLERRLAHPDCDRELAVFTFRRGQRVVWLFLLLSYWLLIYMFNFPYLVHSEHYLALRHSIVLDEILVLAPFFIMLLAALTGFYTQARRQGKWRLGSYIRFHFSQYLIPVVPFLMFTTFIDVERHFPTVEYAMMDWQFLWTLFSISFVCALFTFAPVLLRLLWRCKPFPQGALRERLEAAARRAGVRYSRIYLWQTGGSSVPNALVTGLFSRLRYIFITDAMLSSLTPSEIEAVFAHELGHARRRHIAIFFAIAAIFILIVNSVDDEILPLVESVAYTFSLDANFLYLLYGLAILAIFWVFIFGFVSRRLEQEADFFAAKLTGATQFTAALEKISDVAGGIKFLRGWRHFPIVTRLDNLEKFKRDPRIAQKFQKKINVMLITLLCAAVMGIGLFIRYVRMELSRPQAAILARRAELLHHQSRDEKAQQFIEAALAEAPDTAAFRFLLASIFHNKQEFNKCVDQLKKAIELDPNNELYRTALEQVSGEVNASLP